MKPRLGVLVAAIALVTTGCASGEPAAVNDSAPQGSNAQSEDSGTDEEVAEEESESAPDNEQPTFGDTVSWPNGLSVTVGAVEPYQPSEFAGVEGVDSYVRFEVTVVNNTGTAYDPNGFFLTMQSGDQEMEQLFDSEKGLDGSPTTPVLDGRQARFPIGFGAAVPEDLVLQVDPGVYDNDTGATVTEPVIFTTGG